MVNKSANLPAPEVPERGQHVSSTEWMQSAWWCSVSWGEGGHFRRRRARFFKYCNISPFFICHKIRQCQRFQRHFRNMSSIRVNLRQHGPFGSNLGPTWVQQGTAWTQVGYRCGQLRPNFGQREMLVFHTCFLARWRFVLGYPAWTYIIMYLYTILVKINEELRWIKNI